jgi:hypothetical protein
LDEQAVIAVPLNREGFLLLFHFGATPVQVAVTARNGNWKKVLDSADAAWSGPGSTVPARLRSNADIRLTLSPHSILVLQSID